MWAACGKDPGLNPGFILEQAARSARYSRGEYATLAFDGVAPDPASLGATWRGMLNAASELATALPEEFVGCCVMDAAGNLYKGAAADIPAALAADQIVFHAGCIRGAWPTLQT